MSSSLLFSYPQIGVLPGAGLLGLFAYTFATVLPIFAFAFVGQHMRRTFPDGFTFAEYVRRRFGWPVGSLLGLIFVAFMLCFMLVELNTYASVVNLLGGVNPTVAAIVVALITLLYTSYGGFRGMSKESCVQHCFFAPAALANEPDFVALPCNSIVIHRQCQRCRHLYLHRHRCSSNRERNQHHKGAH